jgi:MoxR-like ATPase
MVATPQMSIEAFSHLARQIESEVGRVIVGQQEVIRSVLIAVIAGRHALLEGVPGLGKTMLIRTLSEVLDLHFNRIQFTPDLMPSDIVGTDILRETESGQRVFEFQPGPIFANLVLADEINRATPKTQSAMLEVMQEKRVTVGGTTYTLEPPFFVLATQNPIEQEGTYPLPEAQLDRFIFKLNVPFPTAQELITIIDRTTGAETPTPQKVANGQDILQMGALALHVPLPTQVNEYVARFVVATHPEGQGATPMVKQYVQYGASPRGAQALILGAKINALLEGRYNVSFDDVKAVAAASLRHRLLLNFEALAEGIKPDAIVADLLNSLSKT